MPNWCFNTLTVSGAPEDLLAFRERARGISSSAEGDGVLALSLHALVPEPEFEDPKESYKFRCTMWGTKWDLGSVDFQESEAALWYEFATAWSPPRNWLRLVAYEFSDLRFVLAYAEPGLRFAGEIVCEDGAVCTTYHTEEPRRYAALVRDHFAGDEGLLDGEDDEAR